MAYKLAQDLGVGLEFVPYTFANLRDLLDKHVIDIAMGPVLVTAYSEEVMNLPHSYMSTPNVLVVPKIHEHKFYNLEKLQERKNLILGGLGYFQQKAAHYFPLSQTRLLNFETNFENAFESKEIDALFWSKELALAYCIEHPNMVVIDFSGGLGSGFLSYPVKDDTFNLMSFINSWMAIQRSNGFEHVQYMYWMIGKNALPPPPRWSILGEVMHWQNDHK